MANNKKRTIQPDKANDGRGAQSGERGGRSTRDTALTIKRVFEPDNERMVAALFRVLGYHVSHDHTADVIGKPSAAFAYERADAYPPAKDNDAGEAAVAAQSPVTPSALESNLSTVTPATLPPQPEGEGVKE